MAEIQGNSKVLLKIGSFFFWAVEIIALSLQYISLIIWYWIYYDLGETFPNRFAAFILYFPIMFGLLSLATILSKHLVGKIVKSKIINVLITIFIHFVIVAIAFILEVWRTASIVINLDLIDFLGQYFSGNLW